MAGSADEQVEADSPRRAATVLGVRVDDVTMDETLDRILALVADGRQTGRCHQVTTVNVDFVVNALEDDELMAILNGASISLPDGMAILWGARMVGEHLRTRVAGADLVPALVGRAASAGRRIALYGGAPGVAERAAAILVERSPGADIWADAGPVFRDLDELTDSHLEPLRAAAPDICCVAFGNPKQERFIARFGSSLAIPVMIGVGGTLDFLVGAQRRAPRWMQRTGIEWLHRASTDPRRLARRYARDAAVFLPRIGRDAITTRLRRRDSPHR